MKALLKEPKKIVPICIAALFFLSIYMNSYPNIAKVVFYPMYREIIKGKFIFDNSDFKIIQTEHFYIYYKDSSIYSLNMIKDTAEESLNCLLPDFNFVIHHKINIVVYPEYSEMADKVGLGKGTTAMGVYYGGIISILEPDRWMGKGFNIKVRFKKEGPMLHELTHYIVDYLSGGNVPVWFTEGVALYEEYRHNNVEWASDKKYNSYYNVQQLEENFYELDEIRAYKQSFLIVNYIAKNYGHNAILDIIRELKFGKSMEQAVNNVLDTSIDELIKRSLAD